jgi:hypothetical protein
MVLPPTQAKQSRLKVQCETCELSKHHRVSFSPSINKSDAPFVLVHTDMWGPS